MMNFCACGVMWSVVRSVVRVLEKRRAYIDILDCDAAHVVGIVWEVRGKREVVRVTVVRWLWNRGFAIVNFGGLA
jgi:hypothetical protein